MASSINGGNGATALVRIQGSGIAHRRANKRQLAALVASVLEGDVGYAPSMGQLAQHFGVSLSYIALARKFSPAKRKAIIAGEDAISFSALLNGPKAPLALPAPKRVSDAELEAIICSAGIERTLNAAASVEARAV